MSSEWRRTRSRAAARSRREREGQLFRQLALELPLAPGLATHLDKASVLRLSLAYLRLGTSLSSGRDSAVESCVEKVLESALGGFLLLVSHSGQIIYTTDGVHAHTGMNQMDLIGQNLFHFMHPCDLKEVRDILSNNSSFWNTGQGPQTGVCEALIYATTPPSRSWKQVLHCTGIRKHAAGSGGLVLLCESVPEPPLSVRDANPEGAAFLSKHTPDMCFSYCHVGINRLYGERACWTVCVQYQYYHALDCKNMLRTHLSLLSKGRVSTGLYRMLVKRGGFVWMETSATVVYDSHTGHPQGVICVNYILSDVEQPDVVLSLKQKEFRMPGSTSPITAPSLVHLAAGSGSSDLQHSTYESGIKVMTPHVLHQDLFEEDLDTLAPYIPMDGEDFPLSPISDMVEDLTETRPQESLFIFPYQETESWGWPGLNPVRVCVYIRVFSCLVPRDDRDGLWGPVTQDWIHV
uniref:Hypoxia-inducible factor 1-alpha n=1 Tax=Paramormyrops kingsleyae TaxID=1676925 RepID=A0A3B3RK80_9TELE